MASQRPLDLATPRRQLCRLPIGPQPVCHLSLSLNLFYWPFHCALWAHANSILLRHRICIQLGHRASAACHAIHRIALALTGSVAQIATGRAASKHGRHRSASSGEQRSAGGHPEQALHAFSPPSYRTRWGPAALSWPSSNSTASIQAVRNIEDNVDSKLQALDNMDADDIERLRQRRLDQMKQAAANKQARHGPNMSSPLLSPILI